MKIQDIAFVLVLLFLIYRFQPRLTVIVGLCCLFLSIPLFATWTFFTAERLTWYGASFFLVSIVQYMIQFRKEKKK